jgi:hypothetical protein
MPPVDDESDSDLAPMPWDQHPSIFEFISSRAVPERPAMSLAAFDLPDEERIRQGKEIQSTAGALDAMTTDHIGSGTDEEKIAKTAALIVNYSREPTALNKAVVYREIIAEQVVSLIDPVIEKLVADKDINPQRLYDLAYSFATESPDREPVKFGIAILGLFAQSDNRELFLTLGRHDEFTWFSAAALASLPGDDDESLWALARSVTGWGRIHVVERLAKTSNPAIKNWLLREGYRNALTDGSLAATCAKAGGLLEALSADTVDRELLTAAGEMIEALIRLGAADGIDDYEDGRAVIEAYLEHIESSAESVGDFLHIESIRGYLTWREDKWAERYKTGWTPECRASLRAACESILKREEWPDRVRAQLSTEDEQEFYDADRAARALGIDNWDIHWRRLLEKPLFAARWEPVMFLCNEERIERVLALAHETIDLAAIATGPATEPGFSRGFEPHCCLDYIVSHLQRFPHRGAKLIEASFQSPVTRNRNAASLALSKWSREQWTNELKNALERAESREPDPHLKERMQKVLRGEPLWGDP